MRGLLTGWLFGFLLLAWATSVPSPSPSSSLPTSKPLQSTDPPTLRIGGVAAAAGPVDLQTAVGADPNPGEPDAGNLEAGSIAYLMAGPERHGGLDWWLVQSERSYDVGWTPSANDGLEMLVAIDPECPPVASLTADQLIGIGPVRGLVCFGDAQLTFDATVFCVSAAVDGGPGGASWMDSNRICHTVGDPAMALFGQAMTSVLGADLAVNPVTARFRITGHFDDPESRRCWDIPVGVNLDAQGEPDPAAVIACRERFVVTEAVRLA